MPYWLFKVKKKKNALLLLMTSHPFQQKQTLQTEPS